MVYYTLGFAQTTSPVPMYFTIKHRDFDDDSQLYEGNRKTERKKNQNRQWRLLYYIPTHIIIIIYGGESVRVTSSTTEVHRRGGLMN